MIIVTTSNTVTSRTFLRSILNFSISSWAGFFMGIASVAVVTRVFTPDITGALNIFTAFVGFFVSFSRIGMNSVVSRFFYEPPYGWTTPELFTRCLTIAILFMLFNSLFLFTDCGEDIFFSLLHTKNYLIRIFFLANALSVMVLTHFLSQYYRYSNDAYNYNIQQILMQFFSKLFVVTAALVNPTLETVLFFNSIGMFILMIMYLIIQYKDFFSWKNTGWNCKEFRPLYRFALYSWPSEMIMQVANFSIPYIIVLLLGTTELGIFSSANFFSTAFMVIQGGFSTYWAAFMYRYYNSQGSKICKVHSYLNLFAITVMGLFIVFQHIAYLLIGESFHGSRLFFTLVILSPVLLLLEQTTAYGMTLSKKIEQNTIITVLCVIINIVALYVCINIYGLLGAALATSFTAAIRYLLMTWRGQVYYHSIRSKKETISGLLILLGLAFSNVLFNDLYYYELCIVLFMLVFAMIVYKKSISELFKMILG